MGAFKKFKKNQNSLLIRPIFDNENLEQRTLLEGIKISINKETIVLNEYEIKELIKKCIDWI